MDYHQSLDYLYGLQKFGIKLGLDNISRLLNRLGSPEHDFAILHVAGTNGKGSTSAALAEILSGSGYRVGLYTSPHLHSFTERIQVDRKPVSDTLVSKVAQQVRFVAGDLPVTFFEATTALALECFRQARVEVVVLETGLGGRLDATNAVTPVLSLITPVSHDHEAYLGSSLTQIAAEKGGIIKPHVPVMIGPQEPEVLTVLYELAAAAGAPVYAVGSDWQIESDGPSFTFTGFDCDLRLESGLPGEHQHHNLGLALAAATLLKQKGWKIDLAAAAKCLANLKWPGRLEWWPDIPGLLLDAAHNPAGCRTLVRYLQQSGVDQVHLVCGFKEDKDWRSMLELLLPLTKHIYVTEPAFQQVADPAEVIDYIIQMGGTASSHVPAGRALEQALTSRCPGEVVVVAGSLFLVSAVREYLLVRESDNDDITL